MADSNEQVVQNPAVKEIQLSKTKGFGSMNYGIRISTIRFSDNAVSVESTGKIFFFKGKSRTDTIEYKDIDKVEVKNNFAKGYLISAIICLILTIAFWEDNGFYGIFVVALLVFCSLWKKYYHY
jgi:hypothetical protein